MYKTLSPSDINTLTVQGCTAESWELVKVAEHCDLHSIQRCHFYGTVQIGLIETTIHTINQAPWPEGIYDSTLCNCTIGNYPVIHRIGMMAHYHIGNCCILHDIGQMIGDDVTHPHYAKIEVMNENGKRSILPFAQMSIAEAYLWARYRQHTHLMNLFEQFTQQERENEGALNRIGDYATIVGCKSLMRVAVRSDAEAPTIIEDCIALHDGVVGYGCCIGMGVMAERFLLGENVHLEMGARINDTVIGDNSTIARCEVGNSFIFPSHEQHHNNSFLIATLVMGQSNIAAGATIGSNHNSRSADGEIRAHRGFWPGLCTSLKHNSRFASYCLLAKGDYPAELNIPFPFALVNNNASTDTLEIMPAYWWMYNMFALDRNARKFAARDRRQHKSNHIEFDLWSPDVAEEIMQAIHILELPKEELNERLSNIEHGKRNVVILKQKEALKAYQDMLYYYCIKTISEYSKGQIPTPLSFDIPRTREWFNMGGQIVQQSDVDTLIQQIEHGAFTNWYMVGSHIDYLWNDYPTTKATHAYALLCELLHSSSIDKQQWNRMNKRYQEIQDLIAERIASSREKDDSNPFRHATSDSETEWESIYKK